MPDVETWNIGCLSNFENIIQCNALLEGQKRLMIFDDYHSGCSWNGGRAFFDEQVPLDEFISIIRYINANGVPFNFTFSNLLLTEEHLADPAGNALLEEFNNGMNGVIIGSHCLARYVRENFRHYMIIHTISVNQRRPEYYYQTRELGLYDLFVPAIELATEYEFIKDFGPEQFEVLTNEDCYMYCPHKDRHYGMIADFNLNWQNGTREGFEAITHFCRTQQKANIEAGVKRHEMSLTEVERLRELGVRHFKISSRGEPLKASIGRLLQKFLFSELGQEA